MLLLFALSCSVFDIAHGADQYADYAGSVHSLSLKDVHVRDGMDPNETLSGADFTDLIWQAFLKDTPELADAIARVDAMEAAKYVTAPEARRLRDGDVNWIMVWRICLCLSGDWPFPAEYFPEIKPQDQVVGVYADARATAIAMGLADGSEYAIARLKGARFLSFLDKLLSGQCGLEAGFMASLPEADLIDFGSSTLEPGNWRAWCGYFKGMGNLPGYWLEEFRATGWKFVFADEYVKPDGTAMEIRGGLTSYATKRIYLNRADERGLYHEFGHYASWAAGYREQLPDLYEDEAGALAEWLGEYAYTNASEYFAECFCLYLYGDDGPEVLRANAPRTYAIISEIIRSAAVKAA